MMNTKFIRQFDEPEAKRALVVIKQRSNKSAKMICKEYDVENIDKLTLRNFKHALHALKLLSQYQIDNLTKYLDKADDGFIPIEVFEEALRLVHAPANLGNSTSGNNLQHNTSIGGASHISGKRESKWGV